MSLVAVLIVGMGGIASALMTMGLVWLFHPWIVLTFVVLITATSASPEVVLSRKKLARPTRHEWSSIWLDPARRLLLVRHHGSVPLFGGILVASMAFLRPLEFGTHSAFLMVFFALGWHLAKKRDSSWSGPLIRMAIVFRLFPALLLVPAAVSQKWRLLSTALVTAVGRRFLLAVVVAAVGCGPSENSMGRVAREAA